ncbi:hypothetical protein A2982_03110 [candidate division WWE3 bacterium RIFCSPLOWO2_01_FULL_39_13]|uniref:Uncharacterized protein n=1 Tax=candidate division WWE3 bacterium RIFCSPLOWO2_01_FULL_39_13 TaxID=1802624 RepID=A0A1F4V252_UNCKA|nr:MAG: hypothetical protein A2982_03110 [candidate division WWE3 bacterium RIFCSPLOWO2_01_FULL_39_13]
MHVSEFSPKATGKGKLIALYSLVLILVVGFGIGVMTMANSFRNFVESKTSQNNYGMYFPDDMMVPDDPQMPL